MTVLSSEFGIQGGDNGDASGRSWSTTSVGWSDRKKVSRCALLSVFVVVGDMTQIPR